MSGSDMDEEIELEKLGPQKPAAPQIHLKEEPHPVKIKIAAVHQKRLIIDRIELENFKSYAHKQVIGPFHHSFSSVVGPNGSGKSNLIECMLFIFGYKANWMRLSKISELVHKSSSVQDAQRAVVSICFKEITDNQDGTINEIRGSQFILRRTVNLQGISKYFINDRESTQGEVKELLMSKGIDLSHNRFLILQGQVEQIASMKQKSGDMDKPGLLEYLEDIIGSSQFVKQLEQQTIKFNDMEQERHVRGERMKFSETELKGMTKGKDEAIKFVKREKQIYQLHNAIIQIDRKSCQQVLQVQEVRFKEAQEKKKRVVQEEKERLAKQTERIKEKALLKQQLGEFEKSQAKLQKQYDKLNETDQHLRNQCRFMTEDQMKMAKKAEEYEKEIAKVVKEAEESQVELPKKTKQLRRVEEELQSLQVDLDKYGPSSSPKELPSLQTQLKRLELNISSLNEKRDLFSHKLQKLLKSTSTGNSSATEKMMNLERLKSQSSQFANALEVANQRLKEEMGNRGKFKELLELLQKEMTRIDGLVRERQAQKKQYGQRKTMAQQIMAKKIPGVLGRLGDLGSVEKKYDDVVSSSCFQLDNIVVETYQSAQAVINFLKENQLGRTTCIILDKITDSASFMNRPFDTPSRTVRLFDIIKPDNDKARLAFYFALRDTLFCQDGNLAKSVAYDDRQRKRVVSRSRNGGFMIIEANGLMSGCAVKKGLIRGGDKKIDVEDKQAQLRLEADKSSIESKIRSVREDLKRAEAVATEIESDINQLQNDKRKLDNQAATISFELQNSQGSDPAKFEKTKKQLEKQLALTEEQIKKQDDEWQKVKAKIKKLEDEQKRRDSPEVVELKERISSLVQQKKELESKVQRYKTKKETMKEKVQKIERDKQDALKKSNSLTNKIEKINKQLKQMEQRAEKILVEMMADKTQVTELKNRQAMISQLNQEDQKLVNEAKAKVQAVKNELQNARQLCNQARQQFDKLTIKLDEKRGQYAKIVANYDFLSELEEIEHMFSEKGNQTVQQISLLDQSLHNNVSDKKFKSKIVSSQMVFKREPTQDYTPQEISQLEHANAVLKSELSLSEMRLSQAEGSGLAIINEFKMKFRQYMDRLRAFEDVKNEMMKCKEEIDRLKEKRLSMFRQGFLVISSKLKEVYQLLTKGGDAELQLIDSLDPFSQGINFSVRPPKKTWKQINKLSGGQKTLSSLSLVFALHYYKPTPLYFMDEIDAALDYKNVSVVANYIKKRTKNAQFIIISLRNNMFQLADKLVGVYKTFDQTKTISIIPEMVMKKIKQSDQKENQGVN